MSKQLEVLESRCELEENTKKDTLLSILSDKYCRTIIEATMNKPKSATELTAETMIPISTVYRRLQILHDSKLLHTSGMISNDGKKLFLYKSKIKGMQSTFNEGEVEIKLILNN